ncbi:hypothetical protein CDEST_07262 [Colletotrichum destructivum]|uniref:Secreted protein n=1 Tax=Colletotrichum destructivum TaxID=34406 RepID=A0AAX4IFK8_9PEZI|nr:hypothetical protein CDEST_07262 [Colletotrichum destructivum]
MRVGTVCMSCIASTFVRCRPVVGDLVGPTSSESRRAEVGERRRRKAEGSPLHRMPNLVLVSSHSGVSIRGTRAVLSSNH